MWFWITELFSLVVVYFSYVFSYLNLSGCLWWSGEILWRKFQNNTTVCVFPSVCALCESIPGKPTNHKSPVSLHPITSSSCMNCTCIHHSCCITSSAWWVFSLYQQAEEDNEQRKRHEQMMMEKLIEQEAMMEQEDQKVQIK